MVFAAALLVVAPFVLSNLCLPVRAYWIGNTASGYVIEDSRKGWDVEHPVGNPIVGGHYNVGYWQLQQWRSSKAPEADALVKFTGRRLGSGNNFVQIHADGLPGAGLTAQDYGSLFQLVQPYGNGTEIYSFIFADETPPLAVAATKFADKQLTLQPYNASDGFQHWSFYQRPFEPASTTAGKENPAVAPVFTSATDA